MVTVVFDANLRPRLWENIDEMRHWIMQAAGVKQIIVKDGPNPVSFEGEDGKLAEFAPTLNPAPVDTTAAGDSFNAGFLSAYLQGTDFKTAIAAGCGVSAHVVSHRGALVKLP